MESAVTLHSSRKKNLLQLFHDIYITRKMSSLEIQSYTDILGG